jgi:hypothetical protein
MLTAFVPGTTPAIQRPAPYLPKVDGENLAQVAEQLRQEVAAASTRNVATAKRSIEQVHQTVSFERRARDTLRSLMERMGEDHGRGDQG